MAVLKAASIVPENDSGRGAHGPTPAYHYRSNFNHEGLIPTVL
jgi:hypothetical protein